VEGGAGVDARRHVSNAWLLIVLIVPTTIVLVIGEFTDPQARLVGLLVFLPAIVAGVGSVPQTVLAGIWSLLALTYSMVRFPEPRVIDAVVNVIGAALFIGFAVLVCRLRISREIEIGRLRGTATALQREILRPFPLADRRVTVNGLYEPVQEDRLVGGDIYDVVSTEHGTLVLIGDVQGKGLPAVGTGIAVIGAFREAAHHQGTLAGVVHALEQATRRRNEDAVRSGEQERFVTALVLCFGDAPQVRAVGCGHLPAYLLGGEQPRKVFLGDSNGVPLGLSDVTPEDLRESTFDFPDGASLMLYTDGLTDARDPQGSFYPLDERLASFGALEEHALVRALAEDVREFSHGMQDDLAILVVRRNGSARPGEDYEV
jgi:serine phosphatase RsbU (regulator of sigma subunit)